MAAPVMSYLICSMALVALIVAMPFFYSIEVAEINNRAAETQLKEIADYTSNTFANLYFLGNSTNEVSFNLTKQLIYLPLTVHNSFYNLSIVSVGGNASKITATFRDNPSISADAWLIPGLKVGSPSSIEIGNKVAVAGYYRNGTIWLGVEK